jgi:DNA repair protein RadC
LALVREGSVPTEWNKQVREAGDVARLMSPLAADLDREHFWTIFLDGKNRVTGLNLVSIGTLTAALVHPREVFKAAIAGTAAAIILCHNHPSGEATPSAEDLALTKRLGEVGELIGIRVLDHIVLGHDATFRSLADDGVLGGSR